MAGDYDGGEVKPSGPVDDGARKSQFLLIGIAVGVPVLILTFVICGGVIYLLTAFA